MEYRVIDWAEYPRRAHFEYFNGMANPYVGVTVETDVTDFMAACKSNGLPFFLSFLYCAGRAANAVPELRQRVIGGRPAEFVSCDTSHTVMRGDGTYGYCRLNCMQPFAAFLPEALRLHEQAKTDAALDDGADADSLLFISTLPWVHYSALTQPTPSPADSNPRITWGKYAEAGGRLTMPVTLLANHALVDGAHLGAFYDALAAEMKKSPFAD